MESLLHLYETCRLCPRRCGVNRLRDESGFCGMSDKARLGRASLHLWEEPCISGTRGSGTVFFAGCSLGCVYCQNRSMISGSVIPGGGADLNDCVSVTGRELSDLFLRIQGAGAHNLNLVTAAHFLPQVYEALSAAKARGLEIPVVYNTSGYELAESLRYLDGLVDIYLTDFRYAASGTAREYSHAPDYPAVATEALREMLRQQSDLSFDENGMLRSGVIVRILLLPGHVKEAMSIVTQLHQNYGDRIGLSLLSQYTPLPETSSDPLLGRRVTKREYEKLVQHALSLGVTKAYIQEGTSAKESFIPSFKGEILL